MSLLTPPRSNIPSRLRTTIRQRVPETVHISEKIQTQPTRHSTKIAGAVIRYTEERPTILTDSTIDLIVNGFVGVEASYGRLREKLAQSGRRAVTFEPARTQHGKGLLLSNVFHPEGLLPRSVWAIMRDIRRKEPDARFNLLSHSMGGPAGAKAARHITEQHGPDIINSLSLHGTAGGCNPRASLPQMGSRFVAMSRHEILPNIPKLRETFTGEQVGLASLLYIVRNPVRTAGEMITVTRSDIVPDLKILKDFGIPTIAVAYPADDLFPADHLETGLANHVSSFSRFEDAAAGHMGPQLYAAEVALAHIQSTQPLHT